MKKIIGFFFMFFLTACLQAPKDIFSEKLNYGANENLPVGKIEVVSFQKEFDSAHHIEKQWPKAPEEIIQTWAKETLKATQKSEERLVVVIREAQVIREELSNPKWYKKDEVKDTLMYRVEFVFKSGTKTKYTAVIKGSAFSQMPQKLSRADKEEQWVQMANQMLDSLQKELVKKLNNVV